MERVALAIWRNRISPVFDEAKRMLVVDVDDGTPCSTGEFHLFRNHLAGKIAHLRELRVDTLICGAISRELSLLLTTHGIVVLPFIAGNSDHVLQAYLKGGLVPPTFCMPGCLNSAKSPKIVKYSTQHSKPTR